MMNLPSLLYSLILISNLLFPVLKDDIYYQPFTSSPVDSVSKATYGVSKTRTPVFNSPSALRKLSGNNYLNQNHLFTPVEFAAFPGTVFKLGKIVKTDMSKLVKVETAEYECNNNCYLPLEFLELYSAKPPARAVPLFPPDKILAKLQILAKTSARYCWGCNFPEGIPRLVELLKLPVEKSKPNHHQLQKGVDCSGLLYYATSGFTPRNTSQLLEFGRSLPISNLAARQIKALLQPLDLILWKGHVIIVLDQNTLLESANKISGKLIQRVIQSSSIERLNQIMRSRKPVDNFHQSPLASKHKFIINRWHPWIN